MNPFVRLVRLAKSYWLWMSLGAFISLLVVLSNMALLGTAGWFLASMAVAGSAGASMNYFLPAAAIRGFAIIRTAGRYFERLVTHEATLRFLSGLRVWFYDHLEPLAPAGMQPYRGADLFSRIGADIDALDNFYLQILVPIFVAFVAMLVAFFFLDKYSLHIALVDTFSLILVGAAIPVLTQYLARKPGRHMLTCSSQLRTSVIDGTQGMSDLMVYGASSWHIKQFQKLSQNLIHSQTDMSSISGFSGAVATFLTYCTTLLVTGIGIILIGEKRLAPVDLPMITLVVMGSFEAVNKLPKAYQYLGHTLMAARRIFEIIDTPITLHEPDLSPIIQDNSLEFRSLSFRYSDAGPWILKHLDLKLSQGQHVALIGPTGSGKSTFINLLTRLWEYQDGDILLGGHSLRTFRFEDLRRKISVVPQKLHLFNASVRDNLLLGNPEADEFKLEEVLCLVCLEQDIRLLPDGYDSYVGEGGLKLSGGQIKRLMIARALLKNSPILILDEPSEGLDPELESRVI
ncbi:MAG: thiol reductant ABC exporter subunit CydC, partial [Pseudomonadota bacterium]|nr:thiol reductant ABC exporter subunit CydC [Pseudomonadota bacterium]